LPKELFYDLNGNKKVIGKEEN